MADTKISELPAATTPLDGTELVPIVQGGVTSQTAASNVGVTDHLDVGTGKQIRFADVNGNYGGVCEYSGDSNTATDVLSFQAATINFDAFLGATTQNLNVIGTATINITECAEIHGTFLQLIPIASAGTGAKLTSLYADADDTAKLNLYAQHVRFIPNTGAAATVDVQIQGPFACNSATPQAKATVNAASTDLATVVALCNQLRAALIANGICV